MKTITYYTTSSRDEFLKYSIIECSTNFLKSKYSYVCKLDSNEINNEIFKDFEKIVNDGYFKTMKNMTFYDMEKISMNNEETLNILFELPCEETMDEYLEKEIYPPQQVNFIIRDFVNILLDLKEYEHHQVILNNVSLQLKRVSYSPFSEIKLNPMAFLLPMLFEKNNYVYINKFLPKEEQQKDEKNQLNYRNDLIQMIQFMFECIEHEESRKVIDTFISELKSNKSIIDIKENEIIKTALKSCEFEFEDIDDYEVDKIIANGGIGEIKTCYRKDDKEMKLFAKKHVFQEQKYLKESILSEGTILKMAHHENFPKFIAMAKEIEKKSDEENETQNENAFYSNNSNVTYHLIMELCDTDVEQYLYEYKEKYNKPISFEVACFIFKQIYSGMKYFHFELGLIHRDIKLRNFLVNYQKEHPEYPIIKLTDFGCSRANAKRNSTYLGFTRKYKAPEINIMAGSYDDRVDIFSLGICLYELMFDKHPSDNENYKNDTDKFMNEIEQGEPLIFDKKFEIPQYKSVISLLKKMITKKDERYSWEQLVNHKFIKYIENLKENERKEE